MAVRSHTWLPSRGPITSDNRSPCLMKSFSTGPTVCAWASPAIPAASLLRDVPRRSSRCHATPLPQARCARWTRPVTFTGPSIGLRQPTATRTVGAGCTATLCGCRSPGMLHELVRRIGHNAQGIGADPALHEVVALGPLHLSASGTSRSSPGWRRPPGRQTRLPGRRDRRRASPPADRRRHRPQRRSLRPRHSSWLPLQQAASRGLVHRRSDAANVAQQQVRLSRRHEAGALPESEVVLVPISGNLTPPGRS
jgi:hypothetical protein